MIEKHNRRASGLKKGAILSEKRGPYEVFARIEWMGADLLVTLWGGTAHIGAVAMASPRPSLRAPERISATSSVFTFTGHKDDVPSKTMSEVLAARLNTKVVVAAGIHWDNIRSGDIRLIADACTALTERIAENLELDNR